MNEEQKNRYRELLISPVRECANYSPKFGHTKEGGFSLAEFQSLYGQDAFYKWLGLDNPLMYSAHKAAGGITSVYRQIGMNIGFRQRNKMGIMLLVLISLSNLIF